MIIKFGHPLRLTSEFDDLEHSKAVAELETIALMLRPCFLDRDACCRFVIDKNIKNSSNASILIQEVLSNSFQIQCTELAMVIYLIVNSRQAGSIPADDVAQGERPLQWVEEDKWIKFSFLDIDTPIMGAGGEEEVADRIEESCLKDIGTRLAELAEVLLGNTTLMSDYLP